MEPVRLIWLSLLLLGCPDSSEDTPPLADVNPPEWAQSASLTASEITASSLKLSWPAATDDKAVTGYSVYTNELLTLSVPSDTTSVTVGGLTPETQFTFVVKARDAAGNVSPVGLKTEAQTKDEGTPKWPAGAQLTATLGLDQSVTLGWTPATDDVAVTAYRLYQDGKAIQDVTGGTLSAQVSNLDAGKIIVFRVQALDGAKNETADGPQASVILPDTQAPVWPDDPGLVAEEISSGTVLLSWPEATDDSGAVSYSIYRDQGQLGLSQETHFTVEGLSADVTYTFTVHAFDEENNQAVGSPTLVLKLADDQGPIWPMDATLSASQITGSSVTLGWTPATDNVGVASYQVLQGNAVVAESAKETSVSIVNLKPLTQYTYVVRALDGVGNVSPNGPSVTFETLKDLAPSWSDDATLTASDVTATTLTLQWTGNAVETDGMTYRIYRSNVEFAAIQAPAKSYEVTGLKPGTNYTFKVELASSGGALSNNGPSLTLTTPDQLGPVWSAESAVVVSKLTDTSLTLSWSGASDDVNVTGYKVYQGKTLLSTVEAPTAHYDVTGLSPWTQYTFQLQAVDAKDNVSTKGPKVSVKTLDLQPPLWSQEAQLSASGIGTNAVTLAWTTASDDVAVTGYHIYQDNVLVGQTESAVLEYTAKGLKAYTEYTFRLEALDGAGNLSVDGPKLAVTTTDGNPPTWPESAQLVATKMTESSLLLGWSKAQDNVGVAGYVVTQGTTVLTSKPTGQLTFEVAGLSPWQNYTFKVSAVDLEGNTSSESLSLDVKTPDNTPPVFDKAAAIKATGVSKSSVTLGWSSASDNGVLTNYQIYQNNVWVGQTSAQTLEYTAKALSAFTNYTFRVEAKDAAGNVSDGGPSVSVTTNDDASPTWPEDAKLIATQIKESSLWLGWPIAQDDVGIAGYRVFQGEKELTSKPIQQTSFKVTGLSGFQEYAFSVKAVDLGGNPSANPLALTVKTVDKTPPQFAKSAKLTAPKVTSDSVTLVWPKASDGGTIVAYKLYQANVLVATVTTLTHTVTGLSPWTVYTFRVEALDAAGHLSSNGPSLDVKTLDESGPTWHPKSDIVATDVTPETLTLTWNGASDDVGVVGYRVYQDDKLIGAVNAPTQTLAVTGLSPWTDYVFRVEALDAASNESASGPKLSIKTLDTEEPLWPANATLTSSNLEPKAVGLSWTAAIDDVAVAIYRVFVNGADAGKTDGLKTQTTVTGLNPWTEYSIYVVAEDAAGNTSAKGPELTLKTPDNQAPTWPANAKLTTGVLGPTSVLLVWPDAIDDVAVTQYRVYQDGSLVGTVSETEFKLSGLTPETNYSFVVEAGDAADNWSTSGPSLVIDTPDNILTNEKVYTLLKPSCVGCHESGSAPFFGSLDAFENGIAKNTSLVLPGNPDDSELVKLMEATSDSNYKQMPLGDKSASFIAQDALGNTLISMADVRKWIQYLPIVPVDEVAEPGGTLNERKRVEQIARNVYDQLGLDNNDFFNTGTMYHTKVPCLGETYVKWTQYPLVSPDAHYIRCGTQTVLFTGKFINTWMGLGGPHWRKRVRRSQAITPGFILRLTHVAQDYCRKAILKEGNDAVLKHVTLADTSAGNEAGVRKNIEHLHLRLLSEKASAKQVDELFELFKLYEAGVEANMTATNKAKAGWIAVCSSLIRDPRWITY